MALLSQMIRTVAITGRTDTLNAWFAGRQGGRWAEQTIGAAFPEAASRSGGTPPPAAAPGPPVDPAKRLGDLADLHERGFITDAEFQDLRARLRV
jgi:hypothetical protein